MKRRLIEHYEVVRKLGAGGSGVVYLANDTLLMRAVVLKILKRGALSIEQMRSTVLREARLASAIEHPNVCAIYEVGDLEDEAYIVMQYVPGESLDKIIANGPASVQLGLSVGIQIADGLSAAHKLGIFHRDLKPGNVMLTDGGVVKILDFGLARRISVAEAEFDPAKPGRAKDVSKRKSRMTYTAHGGTIAYMAPEQFVTGQTSVQSDIFAVGVTLYELLSGRHPFVRPESEEFQSVRAIQFADPQPLTECCPQVPPELAGVVATCLQKTPSGRYSSAAELREALRTIMKTMQLETGILPGDTANNLQVPAAERAQRATGFLSMLAERFRESAEVQKQNTILVLPFQNFGQSGESPLYGYALADAIAARLARMSSLVVRPSSSLMQLPVPMQQMDPLSVGKKLLVQWVLAGNFMRSEKGFDLNWQLLDVPGQSVRAGGTISVPSFDLIAVQTEICNEVFATLQGLGKLQQNGESLAAPRWRRSYRRSICRPAHCSRHSCRGPAHGVTWTKRGRCSKAWWRAMRDLLRDGAAWGLPNWSMCARDSVGRCICWLRGVASTGRLKSIPALSRPICIVCTCCCREARRKAPGMVSSICWGRRITTGTCTWWPARLCAWTECMKKRCSSSTGPCS